MIAVVVTLKDDAGLELFNDGTELVTAVAISLEDDSGLVLTYDGLAGFELTDNATELVMAGGDTLEDDVGLKLTDCPSVIVTTGGVTFAAGTKVAKRGDEIVTLGAVTIVDDAENMKI